MLIPPKPENERERLIALKSTELLDSKKESVFDNLTSLISQTLEFPVVAISLVDDSRQWFKSSLGLDVCETKREISFCGHVVHNGKPLVVPDARKDERFRDNPLVEQNPHLVFYAGVPIRFSYNNHVYLLGTLCVIDFVERKCSSNFLDILEGFAYQIESLIEMRLPSQRYDILSRQLSQKSHQLEYLENDIKKLQTISETDLLTELPNRRYLNRFVEETWQSDLRLENICLMMLDLDGFKSINDKYGHNIGDTVLKNVADGLKSLIRIDEDLICRLGGDEFLFITYNHVQKETEIMAEKILSFFEEAKKDAALKGVTASLGVCVTSNKEDNLDILLEVADELMYKAKSCGKNQYKCRFLN